jgi:hypothetical protein
MIPLTPYMLLILGGFAVFIVVLGATWLRQHLSDER